MNPDDIARRLDAARAKARKPGAETHPEDPMTPFERDLSQPEHGMIDPIQRHKEAVHLNQLISNGEIARLSLTYRGRMSLNGLIYDPRLTCEGCKNGIRQLLSEGAPNAGLN